MKEILVLLAMAKDFAVILVPFTILFTLTLSPVELISNDIGDIKFQEYEETIGVFFTEVNNEEIENVHYYICRNNLDRKKIVFDYGDYQKVNPNMSGAEKKIINEIDELLEKSVINFKKVISGEDNRIGAKIHKFNLDKLGFIK